MVGVILHLFQGHSSSHVSVATTHATKATSGVATSGYFGAISRSVAEINARWRVIGPKNVHGVIGSSDFTCHQEDATKILPHIYASAQRSHAMNVKGNLPTSMLPPVQMCWYSCKDQEFQRNMEARDVSHPFVILTLMCFVSGRTLG